MVPKVTPHQEADQNSRARKWLFFLEALWGGAAIENSGILRYYTTRLVWAPRDLKGVGNHLLLS